MKRTNLRGCVIFLLLIFVLPCIFPTGAPAADEYVFERMWPVLEQSWYFSFPQFLAVDGTGNVYVTDDYDRIQKFSASGAFITGWGGYGSGAGEFDRPMGIAIDAKGNIYVADWGNHRIQKFSSTGAFITQLGGEGKGDGELYHPVGLAIGPSGHVYVADTWNHRVQKFTGSGAFVAKWGSYGSGDGKFDNPMGIGVDSAGNVYVTDYANHRIQKFSASGVFITKWGAKGSGDGTFNHPYGLATDGAGNVYVTEFDNHRVQMFNSEGAFITKWGGYGAGKRQFYNPEGIAVESAGNVYVADTGNNRIQKFDLTGAFIAKWGSDSSGDGEFNDPRGIGMDGAGNIYVTDGFNCRIQKFSSSGEFITKWGSYGSGDGRFNHPFGIAIDHGGNVYVTEFDNHRVQKFSSSGEFITKWGSKGSGDGQLNSPFHIAVDTAGNVYVADWGNHRIQKFSSTGTFLAKWGSEGDEDGEFYHPIGVTVDGLGNVYVADTWNHRIQKFTADGVFITKIAALGSGPGLLNSPVALSVSPQGKIWVTETDNNRVQVFGPPSETTIRKAIIVAGSGPYEGNILWNATQMCANYAFRALNFQGYPAENIYYLSSDTTGDSDNDGIPDADADATNANLEYAVKYWAQDADNLFIYLVGHGRDGAFVMGAFENLQATELDHWLDQAQEFIPDFVAMVYDGCRSGSFVPLLIPPAGKTRVIAASAASGEPAIFEADGSLSFGFMFFAHFFGGANFYDAFLHAKKSVEGAYDLKQNPQIEVDGNGTANDKSDKELAQAIKIGKESPIASDLPRIESVSPDQTLASGETSALIYAQKVNGDGIQEVFAVIKPPGAGNGSADDPVTDLPTLQLVKAKGGTGEFDDYEGVYTGFTTEGVYHIAVFARDGNGLLSLPKETSVIVSSSTDCLSVAGDLSIRVPCAEYNGAAYGFTLDFYHNPDDPSGYYWKLVMATLTTGEGTDCIPIGTDLSMPLPCVAYNGTQYGFTLRFHNNPYDPSGLYWKMDGSTLVAR